MTPTSITPFKIKVTEPCRTIEEGGMAVDTVTTARAVIIEPQLAGQVLMYFLAWNPTVKRFMLEPAWQFEEVEQ